MQQAEAPGRGEVRGFGQQSRIALQRLDGEFEGMWMTDAVWPVASGDVPEQAF